MESFAVVLRYLPLLVEALGTTVALLTLSTLFGTVLGVLGASLRRSSSSVVRYAATAFSWLFRSSPPLIILFLAYFGLGQLGLKLEPFQAAVLGLSLIAGAYFMEIIGAGIGAVDKGQIEAGKALGMSGARISMRIVFPQALPIIIPPYLSSVISNLKDTALASAIAVAELLGVSKLVIASTMRPIEIFTVVAVIFVALSSILVRCQAIAERRLAVQR